MLKYIVLFLKPIIFASIVAAIWSYWIYPLEIGENIQISSGVAIGFFAFSLFLPSLIINEAFKDFRLTCSALKSINKAKLANNTVSLQDSLKKFEDLMEMRIPAIMYALIGAIAIITILLTLLIDYESYWFGLATVLAVCFTKYILFMVAYELDDPTNGRFRIDHNMPEEAKKICSNKRVVILAKIFF